MQAQYIDTDVDRETELENYTYPYASLKRETSVSHGIEDTLQRRMKGGT